MEWFSTPTPLTREKTWTDARPLVSDTASFVQRYLDMALLPGGEVGNTWLDNHKTGNQEGSALYYATTSGKDGFGGERLIQQGGCQCCRTDLFVDSKGGIHVLYRGILNDSIRNMVHTVSVDEGKTFTQPRRISSDNWVLNACPHTGLAMAENTHGLRFAWYMGEEPKGIYYKRSSDNGASFSRRDGISYRRSHTHHGDAILVGGLDFLYPSKDSFGLNIAAVVLFS